MALSQQLQAQLLHPQISGAGLPNRTSAILLQEEKMYPMMVSGLAGEGKGEVRDPSPLTLGLLEEGFSSDDVIILSAASWLAGRSEPEKIEDKVFLHDWLKGLLQEYKVEELDIYTQPYTEAAFSFALIGEVEMARKALVPVVTTYANPFSEGYLAAAYLAQMGDPVGYPALLATLHGVDQHYRLMAARYLPMFQPFGGQIVGGQVVEVAGELKQALHDQSSYVRVEIPYLLAQVNPPDLRAILEQIAESDPAEEVREAAQHALAHLDQKKS
jgi:hypothetical protein